jgi:hypothetical protein
MLTHSAELRWFFGGGVPPEIGRWFGVAQACGGGEARVDQYVLMNGCETLSVKLRDQRFEVKTRVEAPHPVALGVDVTGLMDDWVKWSVTSPVTQPLGTAVQCSDRLVAVAKRRWRHKFRIVDDMPQEVPLGSRPGEGCTAELTSLTIDDQPFWSMAFEAYGPAERVESHLENTGLRWLGRHPPPRAFLIADSCSYPTFLSRMFRN